MDGHFLVCNFSSFLFFLWNCRKKTIFLNICFCFPYGQLYLPYCQHGPKNLLREILWYVLLFLEHEGPVSLVSVSSDSLQVLAATSTGNLGFLDVSSRGYNTLMRSHTDTVLGFSVDGIRRHLTTASSDGTVRIWNMDSLHQVNPNPVSMLSTGLNVF